MELADIDGDGGAVVVVVVVQRGFGIVVVVEGEEGFAVLRTRPSFEAVGFQPIPGSFD